MTRSIALLLLAVATGGAVASGCGNDGPRPSGITVSVEPARSWYRSEQQVLLVATVTDARGEIIEDAEVTFASAPDRAAARGNAGTFTLIETGPVALSGCVEVGGEQLCDKETLLVDDGAPILELTSPPVAAELGGGDAAVIEVAGSVADARDVRVFVNGLPVETDELGRFSTTVAPTFGVNHIGVAATDGLADVSVLQRDILWADDYAPAVGDAGMPRLDLPDGIVLQLAQPFFDDETPLDLSAPLETRDLADLVEAVVSHVDFTASIPDPVVDSGPGFVLRIREVAVADPVATVDVTDDGADLFLRLGQVDVTTAGQLDVSGSVLDLTGGILASMSAYARLTVAKPDIDQRVTATLDELVVAIDAAEGRFDSDEANAVFRLAEGALRSTLEQELRDAFSASLADTLPTVLADALGALDTGLRDQSFDLDSPPLPVMTIGLDARIGDLSTDYRRDLTATLRTSTSVSSPARAESRGTPQLVAQPPGGLFESRPVQLAARLDLLNGVLHGVWSAGLLEFDATELIPERLEGVVESANLRGRLPPVLRPSRGPAEHDLALELGQLELDLVAFGESTRFGVTLTAGVDVELSDGSLALVVAEEPTVRAWIIETDADFGEPRLDDEALEDLLARVVWEQLRGPLVDSLAFDLPSLAVSGIGELAPALDGFELDYRMSQRVDVRGGFLVLDLDLIGSVPQP